MVSLEDLRAEKAEKEAKLASLEATLAELQEELARLQGLPIRGEPWYKRHAPLLGVGVVIAIGGIIALFKKGG